MKRLWNIVLLLGVAFVLGSGVSARAVELFSFGDAEKPKPEFERSGRQITAKLIPRAKSTSVLIAFGTAAGGNLEEVKGVDFETVARPEVDVKNFKSAVFEIRITNVAPGGAAKLSLQSDFFTQSTAFYAFNPKREKPWIVVQAENRPLSGRVRELAVSAVDGGDIDADGQVNGRVTVIGGPRDSFWGYALGTLFIRFFGIFIVLTILMIGMILSGFVFKALERSKTRRGDSRVAPVESPAGRKTVAAPVAAEAAPSGSVPAEVAAAIGAALHLHFSAMGRGGRSGEEKSPESAWASEGRMRMMGARLSVFNRQLR